MIKKDNSTTSYKVSQLEKLRLLSLNEELILEKIEQAENNFNPAKIDLRWSLKTYFNNFETENCNSTKCNERRNPFFISYR